MITYDFIKEEIAKSRANKETTTLLREFIFKVTDTVLIEFYGPNYSTRCLQSSAVIQTILNHFGIKSKLFTGAVCLSKVSKSYPTKIGWAGFWDREHHVWVVNEFNELIDLTISQLHVHPNSLSDDDEPIPAIWWHPLSIWPPIIKYLPNGIVNIKLPNPDRIELKIMRTRALSILNEILAKYTQTDILFSPILLGPEQIQTLTYEGHPWLVKSLAIQDNCIPLPGWVIERIGELTKNCATK